MYRRTGKRLCDVVVAAVASVVFAPLLALTALIVFFSVGRPVFLCQQRPGLNGALFTLFKFRTMRDDRDSDLALLPDAVRLTGVGRILRVTSLDELPELFNVLKGDLSLVGPRPLLPQYLSRYSRRQARRHLVRPGITGWAQVNGRNATTWEQRLLYDEWYVDHVSFALDLRILFLTLSTVVRREGISAEGHATMPEFQGTDRHRPRRQ